MKALLVIDIQRPYISKYEPGLLRKINDMKTGESINKAMKTITASETVDTDQSGTGNENEREYSVKLEDISFKIPADNVTVNNQYDKNRYILKATEWRESCIQYL